MNLSIIEKLTLVAGVYKIKEDKKTLKINIYIAKECEALLNKKNKFNKKGDDKWH